MTSINWFQPSLYIMKITRHHGHHTTFLHTNDINQFLPAITIHHVITRHHGHHTTFQPSQYIMEITRHHGHQIGIFSVTRSEATSAGENEIYLRQWRRLSWCWLGWTWRSDVQLRLLWAEVFGLFIGERLCIRFLIINFRICVGDW